MQETIKQWLQKKEGYDLIETIHKFKLQFNLTDKKVFSYLLKFGYIKG